jgi:hypothetical protein
MKSNFFKDPFELLKIYFHRYMELFLRCPMEGEKPGWIWSACGHTGYRHVLLQTNISHKPNNAMKLWEIPIWDIEYIFSSISVNPSAVSWVGRRIPLKIVVHAAFLGQIHLEIQLMIYLTPGIQMIFYEIPIWDIEDIFLMRCSRASKILCRGNNAYLKLVDCRGPQRMQRICRAAWIVVEVVEPLWTAWTLYKFVENVAYQRM